MKKFIAKRFNSEKGFTLVELLAVLVILGLIVAIAIPAIGNVIEGAKDDTKDAQTQMIIEAARVYEVQDEVDFPVSVQKLIDDGYLDLRQSELGDLVNGQVEKGTDAVEPGRLTFNPNPADEEIPAEDGQ